MAQDGALLDTTALAAEVKGAVEAPSVWVERFARFGYITKGIIYGTVGLLALRAAVGPRPADEGTHGALITILNRPFGLFILALLAFGLVGYALWRFIQATFDTEEKGRSLFGLAQRAGYAVSGLGYGTLALAAFDLIREVLTARNFYTPHDWSVTVLRLPLGPWLLGGVGLVVAGVGLIYIHRAYTRAYCEEVDTTDLGALELVCLMHLGRIGIATRGILYVILGLLIVQAAMEFDPNEVEGLGSALAWLERQPFGPWLLMAVAAGLIAYGIYMGFEARRRHIEADVLDG